MSPFCNPTALECWGLAGVQHSAGKRSVTSPRGRYHGSSSPAILSAGLASAHCAQFLLFWEALLERPRKESGTGYGGRPLADPYQPWLGPPLL